MTASTVKSEEKRLEESVQTGADQARSGVKPTSDTKICAQFKRPMPDPRRHLQKCFDWDPEQLKTAREGILLGECRLQSRRMGLFLTFSDFINFRQDFTATGTSSIG